MITTEEYLFEVKDIIERLAREIHEASQPGAPNCAENAHWLADILIILDKTNDLEESFKLVDRLSHLDSDQEPDQEETTSDLREESANRN